MKIDLKKYNSLLEAYKNDFKENIELELYKWRDIKSFQESWNIDADNFVGMLDKALPKSNYLDSRYFYPRGMILELAKKDPEGVREMFRALFDESKDVQKRMESFASSAEAIRKTHDPGDWKNHYQDANSISVYLWLRYPDTHFLYKFSEAKALVKESGIECNFPRASFDKASIAFQVLSLIREHLSSDSELKAMLMGVLDDSCHKDGNLVTLTGDIAHYAVRFSNSTIIAEKPASPEASEIPVNDDQVRFWWLNASPKVWKMSEWKVGEEQDYTLYNPNGNKRRIFQNFLDASEGDIVICYETNPVKKITTLAKVSRANDGKKVWFQKAETLTEPVDFSIIKGMPELQHMEFLVNPNGSFFKLTEEEYNAIISIIRQNNDEEVESLDAPDYTRSDFLNEVYMDEAHYDELVELLKAKKNIILQGAPGVGKTFCAERLAYSIMGKKDARRIKTVQFHQSYSYEDFIMGYKPAGETFKLRNGVFYNFCIEATNNPGQDYFFIIDEINRGNLSKIFGELLMMIEKDYRGKEITLAYSDQGFHVPENLYIIGMMNTADRSLALIDYALRRRFSFFDMKPGFESEGFKNHIKSVGSVKLEKVINLMSELNADIRDDDSLGYGFEIGHSYFCGKTEAMTDSHVRRVVKYDIIPTIHEYWFDNEKKAKEWSEKLIKVIND